MEYRATGGRKLTAVQVSVLWRRQHEAVMRERRPGMSGLVMPCEGWRRHQGWLRNSDVACWKKQDCWWSRTEAGGRGLKYARFGGLVWFGFYPVCISWAVCLAACLPPCYAALARHCPWVFCPSSEAFRVVRHEVSATTPSFLLWYVPLLVFWGTASLCSPSWPEFTM